MIAYTNNYNFSIQVFTADEKRKTYHYTLSIPTCAPNIALAVGWVTSSQSYKRGWCVFTFIKIQAVIRNWHQICKHKITPQTTKKV